MVQLTAVSSKHWGAGVIRVCCSKTLSLTQTQFEAQDWVYTVSITTTDALTEPLTVPNVILNVQHAPKLQLTLDNSTCRFNDVDGEHGVHGLDV
jgi:hypothetical protein